jgi:hypothetical protein
MPGESIQDVAVSPGLFRGGRGNDRFNRETEGRLLPRYAFGDYPYGRPFSNDTVPWFRIAILAAHISKPVAYATVHFRAWIG